MQNINILKIRSLTFVIIEETVEAELITLDTPKEIFTKSSDDAYLPRWVGDGCCIPSSLCISSHASDAVRLSVSLLTPLNAKLSDFLFYHSDNPTHIHIYEFYI